MSIYSVFPPLQVSSPTVATPDSLALRQSSLTQAERSIITMPSIPSSLSEIAP